MLNVTETRRDFLRAAGLAGAGLALAGCGSLSGRREGKERGAEEVTPVEDLMREHGVLRRTLLVYEESARRLDEARPLPATVIPDAAGIIKRFVEDYHERQEEADVFPRFERGGNRAALAAVLREQHEAGRRLTARIQQLAAPAAASDAESRQPLSAALRLFIRMYRPHAAREDTVLFPAFEQMLTKKEYDAIGERFEERERRMFGEEGWKQFVREADGLEKALGIEELSQFTPPAESA